MLVNSFVKWLGSRVDEDVDLVSQFVELRLEIRLERIFDRVADAFERRL